MHINHTKKEDSYIKFSAVGAFFVSWKRKKNVIYSPSRLMGLNSLAGEGRDAVMDEYIISPPQQRGGATKGGEESGEEVYSFEAGRRQGDRV